MINLLVCAVTNLFRIYLIRRFIQIFCPDTQIEKKKNSYFMADSFSLIQDYIGYFILPG